MFSLVLKKKKKKKKKTKIKIITNFTITTLQSDVSINEIGFTSTI